MELVVTTMPQLQVFPGKTSLEVTAWGHVSGFLSSKRNSGICTAVSGQAFVASVYLPIELTCLISVYKELFFTSQVNFY